MLNNSQIQKTKITPANIVSKKISDNQFSILTEGNTTSCWFSEIATQLAVHTLGIEIQPSGSFGTQYSTHTSFVAKTKINFVLLQPLINKFNQLSLFELAKIATEYKFFGPKTQEPPFHHLGSKSDTKELKDWAVNFYKANKIDDPDSYRALNCNRIIWQEKPTTKLDHNLQNNTNNPVKIESYRQILVNGQELPPLIVQRKNLIILEGYHRLEATLEANIPTIKYILFG